MRLIQRKHRDLWFADRINFKKYDHTFKDISGNCERYQEKFGEAGITYFYTLIDDAVAWS